MLIKCKLSACAIVHVWLHIVVIVVFDASERFKIYMCVAFDGICDDLINLFVLFATIFSIGSISTINDFLCKLFYYSSDQHNFHFWLLYGKWH